MLIMRKLLTKLIDWPFKQPPWKNVIWREVQITLWWCTVLELHMGEHWMKNRITSNKTHSSDVPLSQETDSISSEVREKPQLLQLQ